MSSRSPIFDERLARATPGLRPAEMRVADYFRNSREEVLVASAAELAAQIGTSDATIIRTARALGYTGLGELRRQLASELRSSLSPASRLVRTLDQLSSAPRSAFDSTVDIHAKALEDLRRDITSAMFNDAVDRLVRADRIRIFGIGPSSAIAAYFAFQLNRFGLHAACLQHTGLLLADDLQRLRKGNLLVILAYSRIYPELAALLDRADQLKLQKILLTDTLGIVLRKRIDLVLPVERGKTDSLSMHTGTLALLEALLVGVAAKQPAETVANLKLLNDLRSQIAGKSMELPITDRRRSPRKASPR